MLVRRLDGTICGRTLVVPYDYATSVDSLIGSGNSLNRLTAEWIDSIQNYQVQAERFSAFERIVQDNLKKMISRTYEALAPKSGDNDASRPVPEC